MDKHLFPLYVLGSLILTLFAITLAIVLIIQKQRHVRNAMEHQHDILATRINVQEQSMKLVSEEIHDHVGQLLALSRMYLVSAKKEAIGENTNFLHQSKTLLEQAMNDLRYISHSLNGDLLQDIGLVDFLQRDLDFVRDSSGIECELKIIGVAQVFTQEQSLLIYRIIQESIQNVLKHAEATKLSIRISYANDQVEICIEDNGKGFDVETVRENKSLGLRNVKNRAQILNAVLNIESGVNGSKIEFTTPIFAV